MLRVRLSLPSFQHASHVVKLNKEKAAMIIIHAALLSGSLTLWAGLSHMDFGELR